MHTPIPSRAVVDLAFRHTRPAKGHKGLPKQVIINLHGFLGSKVMFNSANKILSRSLNADIYSLDLRNHGDSPLAKPMNYEVMANDVIHFVNSYPPLREAIHGQGRPLSLIGFSMGGKVAMLTALSEQLGNKVRKLVSIDMPPYYTPKLPIEVDHSLEIIRKIDSGEMWIGSGSDTWKSDVVNLLGLYFAAGFLRVKENEVYNPKEHIRYYLPVNELPGIQDVLKEWPVVYSSRIVPAEDVLFLRGLNSGLIQDDYSLISEVFPRATIKEFNTGHSVLLEDFDNAMTTILDFLSD